LDIALEFDSMPGDVNLLATWVSESDKWCKELQAKIHVKIHLEYNGGEDTPVIVKGLRKSSILVYDRESGNHSN